ncbi:M15 family metallopeptidase [Microbispora sp. RL4-1S]|uniref:M15 family metallopeptidase n=1 Tax=Microbispora oryzae TaxID=2806554 RepID=A0A940WVX6_9ACTN|nr:M15 family metallopeptidase [Microbispora oryzae]MBP2708375.1 M15 family metallopeptidase [Microbispora oryzae]
MTSLRSPRSAAIVLLLAGLTTTACGGGEAPSPTAAPAAAPVESPGTTAAASTGSGGAGSGGAASPDGSSTSVGSPTATVSPTPSVSPTPAGPPPFSAVVEKVSRDEVRHSWHPGCPVPVSDLRKIRMTYWGFDDKAHTGVLVVNRSAAQDMVTVFRKLYGFRFPIHRMEPVDVYKGSDNDSIDADNTSAFNCRSATGSSSWSQHAYGLAVDIDPRENPYVYADGSNAHRNADAFVDRPLRKPGVINAGDRVVRAFAAIGWGWGGAWSGAKDYQHFSSNGR